MNSIEILEQLAEAQYQIRLGLLFNLQQSFRQRDGSVVIDPVTAQAWAESLSTNFDDLPENQKQSYRNIVAQYFGGIEEINNLITDQDESPEDPPSNNLDPTTPNPTPEPDNTPEPESEEE